MDAPFHQFSDLFAQLGLPSDESDIRAFIAKHSPLPQNVELWDAAFWTPAQASLLRDEIAEDADWAETVDQLNLALRAPA
ncbi:DUF2789 domain-containing protein [Cupriavidus metallidurans]|uniref:DUF2789 domain-containing protein n=1 Tax=Cupriavidus TaxID=106589 RepID=UPI000559BDAB|nr:MULTISPECIES: DUF2789 domain-containing protein [Cupriavidus]GMG93067.1 hypothetical protein Cmtc_42870 [Cupriavidus sp. TKC]HBD35864.1 DUF2789 domain-containing protein [Cupriavidus sp.]HBO81463.1 DUF2789 domain-containing protein [Cupriavidus sp.]